MSQLTGSTPSKLWNSYKIGLDVLNAKLNRHAADPGDDRAPIDPDLDHLLAPAKEARPTWERLFEAERRLMPLMSDEMVDADALRKFARGREAGLPETDALEAAFLASTSSSHRRALHEQMVDSLQVHHFKREMERKTCRSTASNLNGLGVMLLAPTVLIIVVLVYNQQIEILAQYHIVLTMWFGLLGAYLSRMIAFQSAMNSIEYDLLTTGFSVWSVLVRLIVGAMGALIMYLMITGRLVGGELFPNLVEFDFFESVNLTMRTELAEVVTPGFGPPTAIQVDDAGGFVKTRMFHPDFAKLLVWATIAGFSERLLPDRLSNLVTLSKKGDGQAVPGDQKI